MIRIITKALHQFFIPGGVLLIGTIVAITYGWAEALPPEILRLTPYAVAGGGIILGWRFNRSKLIYATIALFTVERFLVLPFGNSHSIIIKSAAILLPLNLAYFSLMTERGFITGRGMLRLLLVCIQPALIFAVCRWRPDLIQQWLLDLPQMSMSGSIPLAISQPALFAFIVSFALIITAYYRNRTSLDNAFIWAAVAVFIVLTTQGLSPVADSILLSIAGIILIAGVIETAHTMAFHDQLTGLPGRRALEEEMLKLGSRYAIAMVDIDFFKKFNDTYGHDVGDQVLKMVAVRLSQTGGGSKAFRYGGEEFTILFNGKEAAMAVPHLDRLRKTIEESGFTIRDKKRKENEKDKEITKRGKNNKTATKVSVTISIGVASPPLDQHNDRQAVVKAADKALYKAKEGGRNQVVAA